MLRFINTLLLILVIPALQADGIPQEQLQDQEADQSQCVQERLPRCLELLCKTDSNCTATCEQTIKNECRDAGE